MTISSDLLQALDGYTYRIATEVNHILKKLEINETLFCMISNKYSEKYYKYVLLETVLEAAKREINIDEAINALNNIRIENEIAPYYIISLRATNTIRSIIKNIHSKPTRDKLNYILNNIAF